MYFVSVAEIMAGNGQYQTGKLFTDDSHKSKLEKVRMISYLGETLWQKMDFRINDTPSILTTVSIHIKVTWTLIYT